MRGTHPWIRFARSRRIASQGGEEEGDTALSNARPSTAVPSATARSSTPSDRPLARLSPSHHPPLGTDSSSSPSSLPNVVGTPARTAHSDLPTFRTSEPETRRRIGTSSSASSPNAPTSSRLERGAAHPDLLTPRTSGVAGRTCGMHHSPSESDSSARADGGGSVTGVGGAGEGVKGGGRCASRAR
jgi:hypothetical protein